MTRVRAGLVALVLVLVGTLTHTARPIEVTPPSPVPALSPTVITVTYQTENSFIVVIGVVDGKLFLPTVTDAGSGKLTFSGPVGQYAIVGQEAGNRIQQTIEVVGKDEPDPGPNPDPTPPPGPRAAVIIYESTDASPQFRSAARAVQLYCRDKKHTYRLIDKDAVGPDGQPPSWLSSYITLARQAGLETPFMLVTARSGYAGAKVEVLKVAPFPSDGAAAIKIIQDNGG